MPTIADDLRLALELADLADSITMARYRAPDLAIETKPDLTPVTEADRAVEKALRDRLAIARPSDAILGEEYGATDGGGSRRWILDPIDGTKSYVRALSTWSTLIALEVDDEIVVGVVAMPALSRRWWAACGEGAFADGRRIRVSRIAALADSQLAWSGVEDWDEAGRFDSVLALARACWRTRGVGDAWQYMLVAEGSAEIALDPIVSVWDMAAVKVIVEQAGGRFTDMRGLATADGGSGIATNGLVHEAALEFVGI